VRLVADVISLETLRMDLHAGTTLELFHGRE
jgi:hypothetical protein